MQEGRGLKANLGRDIKFSVREMVMGHKGEGATGADEEWTW